MLLLFLYHGSIYLQDMKIEDPEIVELVNQIEELEQKLHAHPLNKVFISIRINLLEIL